MKGAIIGRGSNCTIVLCLIIICFSHVSAHQILNANYTPLDLIKGENIDNQLTDLNIFDLIFYEDFESSIFSDSWNISVMNQNYSWKLDTVNAHSGNQSICCCHDPQKNPQNEWLISKEINITEYAEVFLDFHWFMSYFWSVSPYNHYDLNVYITNAKNISWIKVWDEEQFGTFDNWIWYNTSKNEYIDLSTFHDYQVIKIGIQYEGIDGATCNVDDIVIFGRRIENRPKVHIGGPYQGYVGENIKFYGQAVDGDPPYRWRWDFGDNMSSTLQNPSHAYEQIGNYSISLTVTDSQGISDTKSSFVIIENMSKVPEVTISNITGPYGVKAIICNKGCIDAYNVSWQIRISNIFVNNITKGQLTCVPKRCCQEIQSSICRGFGIIDVNIIVDADYLQQISYRCKGIMIGKYIFPILYYHSTV